MSDNFRCYDRGLSAFINTALQRGDPKQNQPYELRLTPS